MIARSSEDDHKIENLQSEDDRKIENVQSNILTVLPFTIL